MASSPNATSNDSHWIYYEKYSIVLQKVIFVTYEVFYHISRHAISSYLQCVDIRVFRTKITGFKTSDIAAFRQKYLQTRSSADGETRETLQQTVRRCIQHLTTCAILVVSKVLTYGLLAEKCLMRGVDCSSMSPNVSAKKLSTQGDTEKATGAKLFSGSSKL